MVAIVGIPMLRPAYLGLRAHSGWAAVVAVAGRVVVNRSRLEIADKGIPGSAQPYHAAAKMSLSEAEEFIRSCRDVSERIARAGLLRIIGDLQSAGYEAAGACVLMGAGRQPGSLEKILAAHPLIHTAEGEFYRNVVKEACAACSLKVRCVPERGLPEQPHWIAEMGKKMGPPWREDQKLCAMAASLGLEADSAR